MEITKLLSAKSNENEFVIETVPPLTKDVIDKFNMGFHPGLHLQERENKLVVSKMFYQMVQSLPDAKDDPGDFLVTRLTQAAAAVQKDADDKAKAKQRLLTEVAEKFGVQVE